MKNRISIIMLLSAIVISSALYAENTVKTLNLAFPSAATGFDPAKISDVYSLPVVENIYDTLLTYDYLARPIKIIPNTVEALPAVTNGGKTYTFKIKPGIYFSDDPAFKGKKRELTAKDYAYSFKRMLDQTINSPQSYLVDGKFSGADKLVAQANGGPLNYDSQIEGIKSLDKYTLQVSLTNENHNFATILAMPSFGAVAREVIEANAANTNAHPVGTGPYRLKEWKPGSKIVLEANPNYRHQVFNFEPDLQDPISVQIAKDMQGKTLPQVKRININIIEEAQPTWLAFLNGQLDIVDLPQAIYKDALVIDSNNPLDVTLAKKHLDQGIRLQRKKLLEIVFHFFNMNDSVVGGYSPEKIALRRAIAMGFPRYESIARIRHGQAVPVEYAIPEGVAGHNPNIKSAVQYDPAKANALLDAAGYTIGSDGYRTQPNGSPLTITLGTGSTSYARQWNEFWQQDFDSLNIKLAFKVGKWSELAKANRAGKLQMWGLSWGADYPDGDNFMQMFYGPNKGDANFSGFNLADFNKLYEKTLKLPHGEERQKLYDKMNQLIVNYQPYIYGDTRVRNSVSHSNIQGFKVHPIINSWHYIDIENQ